jgi:opacity protein-like surface antigen
LNKTLVALAMVAGTALPASAQEKTYDFYLGGGVIFPLSTTHSNFNTGGNVVFGGEYHFNDNFSMRAQYRYSHMGANADIFAATNLDGSLSQNVGQLDFVLGSKRNAQGSRFYGFFGPGVYNGKVQITKFDGYVPTVPVCNPWLGICYPVGVPVATILGSRSSTSFGMDVGLGIEFAHHFFIEASYVYVWGPSFTDPNTLVTTRATGQYLPLTLGFRF